MQILRHSDFVIGHSERNYPASAVWNGTYELP